MPKKPHEVLPTREARAQLPAMLERFRQDGAEAEPIVIGARRRPEAVVLSYERYLQLAGGRESVAAILDRQAAILGAGLDEDDAMHLANSEVQAVPGRRILAATATATDTSETPRPDRTDRGIEQEHAHAVARIGVNAAR